MNECVQYQYGKKEYQHLAYGIVIILGAGLLAKGCQDYEIKKGIGGASATRIGNLEKMLVKKWVNII